MLFPPHHLQMSLAASLLQFLPSIKIFIGMGFNCGVGRLFTADISDALCNLDVQFVNNLFLKKEMVLYFFLKCSCHIGSSMRKSDMGLVGFICFY